MIISSDLHKLGIPASYYGMFNNPINLDEKVTSFGTYFKNDKNFIVNIFEWIRDL